MTVTKLLITELTMAIAASHHHCYFDYQGPYV